MCNSCCITAVLMQLVAHYHNKTDGLLCKLTGPCERSGFRKKTRGNSFAGSNNCVVAGCSAALQAFCRV
jgi:hypothetical protein